jgi:hypothetical protein
MSDVNTLTEIVDRAGNINAELDCILTRLNKVADKLIGSPPEIKSEEPVALMDANGLIDSAILRQGHTFDLISNLQDTLCTIEDRI